MTIDKILIVDDEILVRSFLAETLKRRGHEITTAEDGQAAVALLKEHSYDLVITDMKMPGMTGMDVLRKVKEIAPTTIVIVITAFGSIENAVEAMRLGAFNYLIKPFSPDTIEAMIEKVDEHQSLLEENSYLRQQVAKQNSPIADKIIGESGVMKKILSDVIKVAKSNASVFINGESGTGKEVISHAIHYNSHRAHRPYIRVNCAAIPDTLVESEFFGHEKGSFTGALTKRIGRFELANSGSLLLDEITEIPLGLQAKLLRVVQEQEFERVGGSKMVKVDVRLISTSNRNMKEAIEDKIFREDLYYRLNVVPVNLPALRERREDIIPLAEYFLNRMCVENHKNRKYLLPDAKKKLLDYNWPGNIRELANIIERAVVMDFGDAVESDHLYIEHAPVPEIKIGQKNERIPSETSSELSSEILFSEESPVGITLEEMEKRLILKTLEAQNSNRTKTADILGISIRTLRNKLHEYKIPSNTST